MEIVIETGYVIKYREGNEKSDTYYEINGLGDWSFAGNNSSALIFETEEEAIEVMKNESASTPADGKMEVIQITRMVCFARHPLGSYEISLFGDIVGR